MEPLIAGDPIELGGYLIKGRLWSSGALTAFQAQRDGDDHIVLAVKNGPQIKDPSEHGARISELAQSLQLASTQLGASLISGGSSSEYSFLLYELPEGKNLREFIYSGKTLSVETAVALVENGDRLFSNYSAPGRILVTPDTIYVDGDRLSIVGLGAIELLDSSAAPGASLGVNSLEWFAPETLAEGTWTVASAKFSLSASLFAAAATSPWREPVRQLSDLFRRSINIDQLENHPQLEPLFPWLNALPNLRVLETPQVDVTPVATNSVLPEPPPVFSTMTPVESIPPSKRGMYIAIGVVSVALIAAFAAIGLNALGGNTESTTVTADPSPSAESTQTEDDSSPSPTPVTPEYQVRLDYSSDSIPNQPPTDGLQFTFDVCSGDSEWLNKDFARDVQLQLKDGSKWANKPARPKVVKGGRCDSDQYNLTIAHIVEVPEGIQPDALWSQCLSYRVNLPETDNFKKFSVPFCAYVRQTV